MGWLWTEPGVVGAGRRASPAEVVGRGRASPDRTAVLPPRRILRHARQAAWAAAHQAVAARPRQAQSIGGSDSGWREVISSAGEWFAPGAPGARRANPGRGGLQCSTGSSRRSSFWSKQGYEHCACLSDHSAPAIRFKQRTGMGAWWNQTRPHATTVLLRLDPRRHRAASQDLRR